MLKYLFFLLVLRQGSLFSQNWKENLSIPSTSKEWLAYATGVFACGLGGGIHGANQAFHADPHIFEKRWGVSPTSFWGSESWQRKYRRVDGGAYFHERALYTPFSDFWHVSSWSSKGLLIGGTTFLIAGERRSWKWYTARVLTGFVAHSMASAITYNLLRDVR